MSLGNEMKDSQLGDHLAKKKEVIIKAEFTAGSAPTLLNLHSALSVSSETITLAASSLEDGGEILEVLSCQEVNPDSSARYFDGANGALSASLSSGDILIVCEAEDGVASQEAFIKLEFLMK